MNRHNISCFQPSPAQIKNATEYSFLRCVEWKPFSDLSRKWRPNSKINLYMRINPIARKTDKIVSIKIYFMNYPPSEDVIDKYV